MNKLYDVMFYVSEDDEYWRKHTAKSLEEAEQMKQDLEDDGYFKVWIEEVRV